MSRRAVVVGAGISGLSAAHDLVVGGADVTVVEAGDGPGGVIGTHEEAGYRFESGPNAIQGEGMAVRSLCQDLGLESRIIDARDSSRERYLYYHGSLKPLPRSFGDFVRSRLFTGSQKLRVLMEPWVRVGHPDREETVAEFFGRRVGRGVTMTWVDVVVSGIFAGNPNRLGIRSAFPDLAAMEREHGSIMKAMRARANERRRDDGTTGSSPLWSLDGGLGTLIDTLGERLGDRLHYGRRLARIERPPEGGVILKIQGPGGMEDLRADVVILAVKAPTTGILMGPLAPDVADLLFEVEYSPLVVAHAGFDADEVPGLPEGFGYLVPRCMRMRTLGWTFSSSLFANRAPEGKVAMSGFLGGTLDPHAIELQGDLVRHLMLGELALALGQNKIPEPEVFRIVRWADRLPQYNVGHLRRMEAVRRLTEIELPEIVLAGNWVSGVSVDSCVARGREAAREALERLTRDRDTEEAA